MQLSDNQKAFISLVRRGIGLSVDDLPERVDWPALQQLADEQGLSAVVLDGLDAILKEGVLSRDRDMDRKQKKQWIGQILLKEQQYAVQQNVASEMAELLNHHAIRTYVLKGAVIAECYPRPNHRESVDMDCFLLPTEGNEDVWEKGNRVIEKSGCDVNREFYKNSTFHLPGLVVENHRFLTPFRGNERLKRFESFLQEMISKDSGENRFDNTLLLRPPVMVSALFLIEHAYSHFLHEGLNWRHVLDWQMFSRRHKDEIEWASFEAYVDNFGFRKFYNSYSRLAQFLLGEIIEGDLTKEDTMMLDNVWAPLDLHKTLHGVNGKMALAGNTWRARWKYRAFTDISWLKAFWIQVKGYLFIRNPTL